jgi:hypothetical protein
MTSKDCLPINQVLETVAGVEREAAGFYERAAQQTTDEDMAAALRRLLEQKKEAAEVLAGTCETFRCGEAKLEGASEDDVLFINVLAQSGFYRWADKSPEGEQRMTGIETVDAGLQLERNLLLFYMKFFEFSCAAQRPVFSDLINRGQRQVMELSELRRRLIARRP